MKHSFISLFALVALIISASALWAVDPIFRYDLPLDPTLPTFHKLTVHVQGSGKVESNPGNLVCESNMTSPSTTCEGYFYPDTLVALDATAISGENYTASFGQWSGDCSGSVGACALTMNSSKEITAQFAAVGIPLFTLPVPNATETIEYHISSDPLKYPDPSKSKPIAVGKYSDGISIKVGLPPFFQPVDMYLGLSLPNSKDIFLIDSSNTFVNLSGGLVTWKNGIASIVDETLFEDIPTSLLPKGTYDIHFIVTPAGDTSKYYYWRSAFTIFPDMTPLAP